MPFGTIKLFKVWRKNGAEAWLLIHIEVQGRREAAFPERMFVYSYRIYDRYRRPVVSLAVLCDDDPRWKPDHFGYNIGGCEVGIRFPVAKLLIDWMLALPKELEDSFWAEMNRFEEERAMPYVTSVERIGIRKGRCEGLLEAIAIVLKGRFGKVDKQLLAELRAVTDANQLRRIARALTKAKSQEELRGLGR